MNNIENIIPVFLTGILLGVIFYGGLLYTVRKAPFSQHAAWWFFASWLIRTAIVLLGIFFAAGRNWQLILLCLGGFLLARVLITLFSRSLPNGKHKLASEKKQHEHQS